MDFSQSDIEYRRLKAQFDSGQLTEVDFKTQLQDLMVEDEQGRWWTIGYETGQWYVHDGEKWVPADPPHSALSPSTEPPAAMAKPTESAASQNEFAQSAAPAVLAASANVSTAEPKTKTWRALALIMVAWGLCSGFYQFLYDNVGIYGSTRILVIGAWLLAGLATGVAIRMVEPAVRWKHVVLTAFVLGACSLLTLPEVSDKVGFVVGFTLAGLVGGLATGLMVQRTLASVHWVHVLIIAAGWAIAFFVQLKFDQLAYERLPDNFYVGVVAVGGVIAGAIAGVVTLWQIRRAQRSATRQE